MTVRLSYTQTLDILDLAVEERGADFQYERQVYRDHNGERIGDMPVCLYFDRDGTPSCIVGWVLHHLGMNISYCDEDNRVSVEMLATHGVIEADFRTLVLLATAQWYQDHGYHWGFAVKVARTAAESVDDVDDVLLEQLLGDAKLNEFASRQCNRHYGPQTQPVAQPVVEETRELVAA